MSDTKHETTLREAVEKLRAIPAKWKELEDPLDEVRRIREGLPPSEDWQRLFGDDSVSTR
jgi:hypothetical protein